MTSFLDWKNYHVDSVVFPYLVADGKLEVGGSVLLSDPQDLVADELGVFDKLMVVVDVVVGDQQRPSNKKYDSYIFSSHLWFLII